jgi:transposase InsO family protein
MHYAMNKKALNKSNTYRSHRKLDNLTPIEYIEYNNFETNVGLKMC